MQEYTKIFDNCLAVFQGGGCKAVAYIGAYKASLERGVLFSELAGTSAGAIIASLISAGAKPEDIENFLVNFKFDDIIQSVRRLKTKSILIGVIILILSPILFPLILLLLPFIALCARRAKRKNKQNCFFRLLKKIINSLFVSKGLCSIEPIEKKLSTELRRLTKLDREVTFADLTPNLHVVASDIYTNKERIWDKKRDANFSVAKAVSASCAYPLFFQPVNERYVDGGLLCNLPNVLFADHPHYNKILSFQLESQDKDDSFKMAFTTFLIEMISTVVEGAVSMQNTLGIKIYPISIPITNIRALDFNLLKPEKIKELIDSGERAAQKILSEVERPEDLIESNPFNRNIESYEQIYSWVATQSKAVIHPIHKDSSNRQYRKILTSLGVKKEVNVVVTKETYITRKVFVSTNNTLWAWALLPTVIRWVGGKTKIVIYLPPQNEQTDPCEKARRRLLKHLGCSVNETGIDVCGFFVLNDAQWKGVSFIEKNEKSDKNGKSKIAFSQGCYYDHKIDSAAIKSWIEKIPNHEKAEAECRELTLVLKPLHLSVIETLLKKQQMYADAVFSMQLVDIKELIFMSPYIRLEKYRQIDYLCDLYNQSPDLEIFEPAEMEILDGWRVIVSPVILEKKDGKLYIIEGNTRLKYAYTHGVKQIKAVVIENVKAGLPIEDEADCRDVQRVFLTDNKPPINLNCKERFRHIEEWLHPSDKFLIEQYY